MKRSSKFFNKISKKNIQTYANGQNNLMENFFNKFQILSKFSPEKEKFFIEKFSIAKLDASLNASIFNEVKHFITEGKKYKTIGNIHSDKSLNSLIKAVSIAEELSRNTLLDSGQKKFLSQAYGEYAEALYQFTPKEVDKLAESISKSLELDPENELAKNLYVTMNFYTPIQSI